MTVYLRAGRTPVVAELHAPFTWPCPFTGRPESYLRGFLSRDRARSYAAGKGWEVVEA